MQNLAPGAAARLGLAYESLREAHPTLIVCDISGFGSDGPYRNKKAYDLMIQSESGLLSITGTPDAPAKAGCSIADISAGMYAYSNILTALIQRGRTDRGCRIDVSMLETMAEWMSHALYYAFEGAPPPSRAGAAHATIYPSRSGPNWRATSINSKRSAARDALYSIIAEIFAGLSAEQVIARLESAQIANARVNDMHDIWKHPQLHARSRWTQIGTSAGMIPALLPPGLAGDSSARMGPVPTAGQHTDSILAELGWRAADVDRLRIGGAI